MVSINLTLFIQLGLFLLFIWAVNRLVIDPVLRIMDERHMKVERDQDSARADSDEAQMLEGSYASELGAARRQATARIEQARREAMDVRLNALNGRRIQADEEVSAIREMADSQIESQRPQFDGLADDIAGAIADRLQEGGPRP